MLHLTAWDAEPTKLSHALVGFILSTIFSLITGLSISYFYDPHLQQYYYDNPAFAIFEFLTAFISLILVVKTIITMCNGSEIKNEEPAEVDVNYEDEDKYLDSKTMHLYCCSIKLSYKNYLVYYMIAITWLYLPLYLMDYSILDENLSQSNCYFDSVEYYEDTCLGSLKGTMFDIE